MERKRGPDIRARWIPKFAETSTIKTATKTTTILTTTKMTATEDGERSRE